MVLVTVKGPQDEYEVEFRGWCYAEEYATMLLEKRSAFSEDLPKITIFDDETLEIKTIKASFLLENMDLSVRSYNCLKRHGITCSADIGKYSIDDILNIRNLGRKGAIEVITKFIELQ